jgi:5-methylcytosine-specific restriction protein B
LTELEPGDVVVANRGTSAVVGIGVVREPGYQWRPERPEYKHTINVDWNDTAERSIEPVRRWATVTVAPVSQAQYRRILDTASRKGMPGQPPGNGLPPVKPESVLLDVQAAIQRKGQVILHGPPGTGKTYTARRFAAWWLLNRGGADDAGAVLGDPDRLAAAEAVLTKPGQAGVGQLTRVTFHPSYAYEDFVEGYKRGQPAPAAWNWNCVTGSSSVSAKPPQPIRTGRTCWSSMRSIAATCPRSSASSSPSWRSTSAAWRSSWPRAVRALPCRPTCLCSAP